VTITSAPSVTCTGTGTNGATVNFVGTGTCTITATQAGTTYYNAVTTTTTISVTAAVVNPTKYLVTAPANVTAGVAFTVTIKAADASNNVLTTYNASPTVNLTSNSGASPNNIAPTLPSGALTFTNGTATASVTLTRADTGRTVTATTGSVTGTSGAITVAAAAPSTLAYVNVSSTGGAVTGTCVGGGSCGASGMNNKAFSAAVAVTDSFGNTSSNLGSSHSVTVSVSPAGSGSFAPSGSSVTLIVPGTGTATSSQQFTYNAPNGSWTSVTLTATSAGYTSVGATLSH
jgi:hypothetical protein